MAITPTFAYFIIPITLGRMIVVRYTDCMKQNTNGFQQGNTAAVGHGRKRGQTTDVKLRAVKETVIDNLIAAANGGDVQASAALFSYFNKRST